MHAALDQATRWTSERTIVEEDWVEQFLVLTDGLPTPPIFRLWTGIAALAAVCERRVWLPTSQQVLYPNLFVVLVGPPGTGKDQAITPARRLLEASKSVLLSPDDMTKAAMIDVLAKCTRRMAYQGETREYHPLCVIVPEMGTLVHEHDREFLSVLNKLFDNGDVHRSQRRGHNGGVEISIKNPSLNILAGTQPGYLASLLPEEAWHMGWTSRLLMIYAPEGPRTDWFDTRRANVELFTRLAKALADRGKLVGPFAISDDAKQVLRAWASAGMPPVPEHTRLTHYRARRGAFVLKLSMLAAISRSCALHVTRADVERAKSWLLSAETLMPDIFRDMMQKSDSVLMNECHRFALNAWQNSSPRDVTKRLPIHKSQLLRFLLLRCPHNAAEKILDVMVQADWIAQDHNNPMLYVPRARGFHAND